VENASTMVTAVSIERQPVSGLNEKTGKKKTKGAKLPSSPGRVSRAEPGTQATTNRLNNFE